MMNNVPYLLASDTTMIYVVNVLIQVTLVIAAALLLSRWLRHQPALRHSLLLGGLICVLLCPAATYLADCMGVSFISIHPPFNPSPDGRATSLTALRELPAALSSGEEPTTFASFPKSGDTKPATTPLEDSDIHSARKQSSSAVRIGASAKAVPAEAPGRIPASAAARRGIWTNIAGLSTFWAALIWLAGMAVISQRLLLAWRCLRTLRSGALPCDERRLAELPRVCEDVLRAVPLQQMPPLLVSRQLKAPISLGLFRPVIILPQEMILSMNASQLRDVLIHETAHIHRRDHIVVLLQRLASVLFWPVPLVRRLNAEIDQAREDVCDNYVLHHTEAPQFSRTLLELTEKAAPLRAIPWAIGLWQCRRKLEQRVAALLDPRRTMRTRLPRRTLSMLALAFTLMVLLLVGSRLTQASRVQAREADRRRPDSIPVAHEKRVAGGDGFWDRDPRLSCCG